jgi:hypothetical protein
MLGMPTLKRSFICTEDLGTELDVKSFLYRMSHKMAETEWHSWQVTSGQNKQQAVGLKYIARLLICRVFRLFFHVINTSEDTSGIWTVMRMTPKVRQPLGTTKGKTV